MFVESSSVNKPACSLVVNVGSFDDPHDRPGFAHFVEHLLFNGNYHNPEPGYLNNFVSKHGGHCNAWTSSEHTCFHMDINKDAFDNALEYFANLFISPLFSDSAIKKEQQAIHSEYKLKLQDDGRRIQQVHKETSSAKHPFSKFAVGNRHTLSDLPGRPVIDEINHFWQTYYCAQLMTLTIVTEQTTSELINLVKQLFSQIQQITANKNIHPPLPSLYEDEHLGLFINIVPYKELHKLNISFPMPPASHWHESKLVSYLAHIINFEGKGSLSELLRQRGLANLLSAGGGLQGSNFKDFNISIELTTAGEQYIDEVLQLIFSFINWLKKNEPPHYIYEEQRRLLQTSFTYQEDVKPMQLANAIALSMQHYEIDEVLFADYRMDGYSAKSWQDLCNYLSAFNIRITLLSPDVTPTKKAHWYHTPYHVEKIPHDVLQQLDEEPAGDFKHPTPNPYLQNDVYLEEPAFSGNKPIKFAEGKGHRAWFKQDISYRVPKGTVFIGFDLEEGVKTLRNQSQLRLFCELFLDAVSEEHFQAEMAGLNYNLYAHNTGLTIYTSGLSGGQPKLVQDLVKNLISVKFSEVRFNETKRQLIKHWRNNLNLKPINQLFTHLNKELLPQVACSSELAEELEPISFPEFIQFRKGLFQSVFFEMLVYGNWSKQQAIEIKDQLLQQLSKSTLQCETPPLIPNIIKDDLEKFKPVQQQDKAALFYLQSPTLDIFDKALFILISQMLSPFSFEFLRNQHQLGYLAGAGYMPIANKAGLAVYVQSNHTESQALLQHITLCIEDFSDALEQTSEQDLTLHKNAVIQQYSEEPNNLNQKAQQLWTSIGHRDYSFDNKQEIIKNLQAISKQDLMAFCNDVLLGQSLAIQLCSKNQP